MAKKKRTAPKKSGPVKPAAAGGKTEAPPIKHSPKSAGNAAPRRSLIRRLRLPLAGAALIAAAAVVFFSTRPKPVPVLRDGRMNVVLVTLDTTRADRLGCYGYAAGRTPNLDALAEGGVRFSNAYSQVPLTLPSHASIMTGQYPYAHGVHNNGTYALGAKTATLAQVFKGKGYKTAAFVASFSLDSRFGLDRGFDIYDDNFQSNSPFKSANAERKAEEVFQAFEPWFDKNAAEDAPFFVWIHFFDPHLPYNPPSPLREQFAGRLYDGEVAYMDAIFGLVMRKLVARKLLSSTLVVASGDHGESFGEKGEFGHGVFLYEPAIHVPLIVFAEGRLPAGEVIPSRVRLIDIMPTILDLTETPIPDKIQGRSLVPYIQKKKTADLENVLETFYPRENFGWAALTGLMAEQWKFIHAPTDELYDLREDPAESHNVAAGNRASADLKTRLDASLKSAVGAAASGRALTEEEKSRLRSLGYVDYSHPKARSGAADPKDRIGELKMIQDAEKFEYEGRFAEAEELHVRMLALRPDAASSYINLALIQARLMKFEEAVATLKKGLERIPDAEPLLTRLGFTYLVMNKPEAALAVMKDVLKINPRSMDALTACAIILEGLNRKDEARGFVERALAIEPENKFLRLGLAGNLASVGRLGEAIPIYTRLTQDFPRDPGPYRLLGIAYGMSGDLDRSIASFKALIDFAPNPEAYFNLALACGKKGDLAEEVRYLERYLDDPKGESEARIRQARLELEHVKARMR
jgi:arylsulfatase A-like enzyme/Flp pilus assembly protein TadD